MLKTASIIQINNNEKVKKVADFLLSQLALLQFALREIRIIINNKVEELSVEICDSWRESDVILVVFCECDTDFIDKTIVFLSGGKFKRKSVINLQRVYFVRADCAERSFEVVVKPYLLDFIAKQSYRKVWEIDGNSVDLMKKLNGLVEVEINEKLVVLRSDLFENIVKSGIILKNLNFKEIDEYLNYDRIYESNDEHVRNSLKLIEESFSKYGFEKIFLSFNGGKDCTVLLHLIKAVLYKKFPNIPKKLIFCLYVKSASPFPQQEIFIKNCEIFFNLKIFAILSPIKNALEQVLKENPDFKACLMGTRRTDPYSENLNYFQMTDPDWPQLMRISPLLDWLYSDIWNYLLFYKIPYCELYDLGYTSLGNSANTVKNPALFHENRHLPAYKLLNELKERSGRN